MYSACQQQINGKVAGLFQYTNTLANLLFIFYYSKKEFPNLVLLHTLGYRRNLSTVPYVEISYLKKKKKNDSRSTKNSYIFENVGNKYYTENDFILTDYYPVRIKFNKTIFD